MLGAITRHWLHKRYTARRRGEVRAEGLDGVGNSCGLPLNGTSDPPLPPVGNVVAKKAGVRRSAAGRCARVIVPQQTDLPFPLVPSVLYYPHEA